MKATVSIILAAAVLRMACFAQSFQNLNFENADVSDPDYLHTVPFTNAFPGWQANTLRAYYNYPDLDQVTIGIYDTNAPQIYFFASHPIFGRYTAYVEWDLGSARSGAMDLYQSGVIPPGAQSLRFRTTSYSSLSGFSAQMSLHVNGATIPFVPVQVDAISTIWGADIASYANTFSEVRFAFRAVYPFAGTDPHVFLGIGLDSISFSSVAVPEPSVTMLLVAGLAAIWVVRQHRTKSFSSALHLRK